MTSWSFMPPAPERGTGSDIGRGGYRPSQGLRVMLALAERLRLGSLTLVLPDGTRHRFRGDEPAPDAELTVHRDRVARRLLIGGGLGFQEAYLDGDWSSPDIEALFTLALLNEDRLFAALNGRTWFRAMQRLIHVMRPNSRKGARRNIAHHYDLGNAFYERWLDRSMTYSSALFDPVEADLTAAQRNKYSTLARRMALGPDHHVLEIGCGWGGFAEFAASEIGARVTAITISREQHDYALRRIHQAGLAERVDIRLEDYRDTQGRYDRVASIEMFEAVGEAYWPAFFATVRDRLTHGGIAALQVITIADQFFDGYRRKMDYIQKYIFPGGMLPSPGVLRDQIRKAGLHFGEMAGYGRDYARTLREWNRRFHDAWPDIQRMGFDARFKRMWEQYLGSCAAGFSVGTIDVVQVVARRD